MNLHELFIEINAQKCMKENGNQKFLIYFSKFSEAFSKKHSHDNADTKFNSMYIKSIVSRNVPVCIANDLPEVEGSILGKARVFFFSVLYGVQTDSGSHLDSYPMVTGRKTAED
jgi:hypothetical protein